MKNRFFIEIPDGQPRKLAVGWLFLGMATLVTAGLYALLLVLSRTPYVKDIFPWVDFFYTALAVHVDFTVLFWFLSFAGVFWSLSSTEKFAKLSWIALILSSLGAGTIALSPFIGVANPLINNYIPVLQDPLFFIGLITFGVGFTLLVIHAIIAIPPFKEWKEEEVALRTGNLLAAIVGFISMVAFIWSYIQVPETLDGERYYELLFWGGGHTLQFIHSTLMIVAWFWIASAIGINLRITTNVALVIFAAGVSLTFLVPWPYLAYQIENPAHTEWFISLMRVGGGIAALPAGLILLLGILTFKEKTDSVTRPLYWGLIFTILLFAAGGIVGFMIEGSNTKITAHYHGTNVSVTLAFMILVYYLLPKIGFQAVKSRLALIQVVMYGGGQLMHVIGLAWAGGHGMQRKIAGSNQALDNIQQTIAMGLMGIGGVVAIIGGIVFFFVVFPAMKRKKEQ